MANAMVGALRVTLGLNSAAFSKGIDKANKKSETFGKKIAKSMKMIAGVSAAAAGAISLAVNGVLQDADKMAKASRKIGVPIDELTELRHAAELSGVSFGGLENSLKRLSANMHDASKGVGEGAKAFEELGVTVINSDGSLKSAGDVMGELAERFEKMPDGAQKTALAMRVMGKSGADMIPMLNGGSKALEDMAKEAVSLGLVFDERTGRQAEAFNDNITRLQRSFTGLANKLTAQILPSLLALSQRMLDGISNSDGLSNMTDALAIGFNGLIQVVDVVIDNFSHLYDLFKLFVAAKTVSFIVALTGSFITLAKGIRVAGVTMMLFNKAKKISIAGFVLLGGVIAKITGTYEDLEHTLKTLWAELSSLIPKELSEGAEELAGELKELVIGTDGAANSFSTYLRVADQAANSFGDIGQAATRAGASISRAASSAIDPWKGLRKSTSQALEKFKEIKDYAADLTKGFVSDLRSGLEAGKGFWNSFGDAAMNVLNKIMDTMISNSIDNFFGSVTTGSKGGGILSSLGKLLGFSEGGYTGNGGKYEPQGIVHGGEYVFSKDRVKQLGLGFLERLHGGYANGGYVQSGAPAMSMPTMRSATPANQNIVVTGHIQVTSNDEKFKAEMVEISAGVVESAAPSIVSQSTADAKKSFSKGGFDSAAGGRFGLAARANSR